MKRIVCWIVCSWFAALVKAQVRPLPLSTNKTASLIFPFPVKHVDRGSKNVLVQSVPEADNILLVKADAKGFAETNLTVITSDGSLYTFEVCFDPNPLMWTYELPAQTGASTAAYAKSLLDNPATIKGIGDRKGGMEAKVCGIYVKNDVLFLQLRLTNSTAIDYTVDYLRFSIRDQRRLTRTAVQEVDQTPLYVAGNAKAVKAGGTTTVVVALETFVIPDQKTFVIETGEKSGGRHLTLTLKNKNILKAIPLPDQQ